MLFLPISLTIDELMSLAGAGLAMLTLNTADAAHLIISNEVLQAD